MAQAMCSTPSSWKKVPVELQFFERVALVRRKNSHHPYPKFRWPPSAFERPGVANKTSIDGWTCWLWRSVSVVDVVVAEKTLRTKSPLASCGYCFIIKHTTINSVKGGHRAMRNTNAFGWYHLPCSIDPCQVVKVSLPLFIISLFRRTKDGTHW